MDSRRGLRIGRRAGVIALVLALVLTGVSLAAISGSPELSAHLTDNRVSPGESTTLQVSIVNEGTVDQGSTRAPQLTNRVTTARGTTARLRSGGAPISIESGRVALGSVPEGAVPATFAVDVDEDAEPGTYRLPVEVEYAYTDRIYEQNGNYEEQQIYRTLHVTVVVTEEARFEVVSVDTSAAVGGSGPVSVTLRNDGAAAAEDATVSLASPSGALSFGSTGTAQTFVGDWPAGETRNVTVDAAVAAGADRRDFPVDATVAYTDDGSQVGTDPIRLGVRPAPEQSFDVVEPTATLRVGDEGRLGGSLVNRGPNTVENAVLVLQPTGSNVDAVESEFALGDIAPGERAEFGFDVEVSTAARDGPRQFTYRLEYEGDDGETRRSDPIYQRGVVEQARDTFDVAVERATFDPGESGRFTIRVTNAGDETLEDVSAKLFADAPVSASDDEAFVDSLEPGESATVSFGVSVAGSATPKTYPVSLDFQYTEPDGDTKLSDTYRLPVTVERSGGGGLLFVGGGTVAGIGVAALALVAIGGVLRVR